ncbi:hypothetical protein BDR26DRAFT_932298 [Obelidium mucronatum]|nr:hypothetical protein BDR26DRAFT_932298 [Obelidium mucronatum]
MGPKTRQQQIATPQTPKKKQQPITAYATPVSKTPKKRQAAELDLPQDWDSSDDDNDEAHQVTRGSQPSSPSKRAAQRIKLAKAPPPLTEDEREKLHQFDLDMKASSFQISMISNSAPFHSLVPILVFPDWNGGSEPKSLILSHLLTFSQYSMLKEERNGKRFKKAFGVTSKKQTMFGCIVAGRLVQTNLQQVDQSKYVFELHDATSINHIVVFLLGTTPFPQGYGATVHFLWYVYYRTKNRQAVFKLGQKQSSSSGSAGDSMMEDSNPNLLAHEPTITASLGISIEPLESCMRAVEAAKTHIDSAMGGSEMALSTTKSIGSDPHVIGSKLMESLYNYCSSFATNLPPGGNALFGRDWNTTFVPLKAIQDWYQNLQRKFKIDPSGSFLKNNN